MCGNATQMSHFLSAFSSGTYSISLRGLAMLNGGSQTWTLKGYHGFSSASVAGVDIARNATPPSKAAPSAVADCVMPLSAFMGAQAAHADAPLLFVVEARRPLAGRLNCHCVTKARFCHAQKSGTICTRLRSSRSIAAEFKRRKKDSNSVFRSTRELEFQLAAASEKPVMARGMDRTESGKISTDERRSNKLCNAISSKLHGISAWARPINRSPSLCKRTRRC